MPENAAAEGGFGRDAPSRSDDNDRGGAREDKESRAEKAESFDRAMDNANRPDRASAAPSNTTTVSDDDEDDRNTIDKTDDRQDRAAGPPGIGAPPSSAPSTDTNKEPGDKDDQDDRGILDRIGDALTAPPTDAEGNTRSTSPVADRIRNHTQNYSLEDLRDVFTPEQSQALADSAAVMEGVVAPAPTTPREQLSLYQADLRLQQRGLDYQRALLGENPHPRSPNAGKAAAIDRELARLAERQELVETVARPDLTTGIAPEILHFDPKEDGQIVVAHGDIRNASHIAVMVPGMTTDLENFNATNNRAKELLNELSKEAGVTPAVIGYFGYDAPDNLVEAISDDYATDGAPVFADFLDALPKEAETHVLAHSYGSLLTGKSLAEGARPDYAHVFGSPGIGVDSLDELNLEGQTVVTVTSNPGDRVVTFGIFGEMPPDDAISYPAMGNPPPEDSLEADDYEPHVDYFDPDVLVDIVMGRREPIAAED